MNTRTVAALGIFVAPTLLGVGTAAASAGGTIDSSSVSATVDAKKKPIVKRAKVTKTKPKNCSPSSYYVMNKQKRERVGKFCFQPYGDIFWMKDIKADGMSVRMHGFTGTTNIRNYGCKPSVGASKKWQYCKFSKQMPEKRSVSTMGAVAKKGDVKYTSGRHVGFTS